MSDYDSEIPPVPPPHNDNRWTSDDRVLVLLVFGCRDNVDIINQHRDYCEKVEAHLRFVSVARIHDIGLIHLRGPLMQMASFCVALVDDPQPNREIEERVILLVEDALDVGKWGPSWAERGYRTALENYLKSFSALSLLFLELARVGRSEGPPRSLLQEGASWVRALYGVKT